MLLSWSYDDMKNWLCSGTIKYESFFFIKENNDHRSVHWCVNKAESM